MVHWFTGVACCPEFDITGLACRRFNVELLLCLFFGFFLGDFLAPFDVPLGSTSRALILRVNGVSMAL